MSQKIGVCESEDWSRVYLASYPRSGNHWVRFLIEEATHIATSSAYPDSTHGGASRPHTKQVFPWGGFCAENGYEGNCRYPEANDPVVIKTHHPQIPGKANGFSLRPYISVIRLVRHPVDSFYSFYVFDQKRFKPQEHPLLSREELENFIFPLDLVKKFIDQWSNFQTYWDHQPMVVTIRYEDLIQNPHDYLRLILNTIGYAVTEEDIERAVAKYPPKDTFLKHSKHYSPEDLSLIESELSPLLNQFHYTIDTIGEPL